jgi:Na+/citrate or Na+/malate symporter
MCLLAMIFIAAIIVGSVLGTESRNNNAKSKVFYIFFSFEVEDN